jgi:hypothetical protein
MLKIRSTFSTALAQTIQVEAGSSIPYLVCNLIHSILCISQLIEPEGIQPMDISFFTAIRARYFDILLF